MSCRLQPCTFCYCSKGYLDKRNEDRSPHERAHCSSYHSTEVTDLIYQDVLFRFRRDPSSDMKFKCICDSALSSTQSLFNHVKGSSNTAAKRRRVCEKIAQVSSTVRASGKAFHDANTTTATSTSTKDPEAMELFNAWPVEHAPVAQGSNCCVPVVYDALQAAPADEVGAPTPNSPSPTYADDSLKDMMQAILKGLDEIKERMNVLENQQRSQEASFTDLKSQMSIMSQAVSSLIVSRTNVP
ncbi:hypothetical protein FBU30_010751 [Linnemannia zychae]|nr:hypothetical protein FBU30_010751 [Linnemannia zychae]